MNDVHEVLVKTRALIADEKDWCGNGWGMGGRRCLVHALVMAEKLEGVPHWTALQPTPAFILLKDLSGAPFLDDWNDSRTHAQVLALIDCALQLTKPPEPPDPEDLYVPESWLTVAA